jgi:Uncharacterised protein family (UPF0158)
MSTRCFSALREGSVKERSINFEEVRKAMEDTVRDAFDYFLDRETGDIIILSEEIIGRTREILEEEFDDDMAAFEEVELYGEYDIPDWMEDEVELALRIFLEKQDRYVRIPERRPEKVFSAMREFTEGIENTALREELLAILDGKGSFRRFKDALDPHPKERKQWYGFSAKKARQEIGDWLQSIGVGSQQEDDRREGTG